MKAVIQKSMFLLGVLSAVMLITAAVATVAWAAWTWTGHSWHLFNNIAGDFEMAVDNYFDNNTSSSVTLGDATLWIRNPERCCIGVERVNVWDGQGANPWSEQKNDPVDVGQLKIVPLSLGFQSYTKLPGGYVTVENRVGYAGTCDGGFCSTTYIVWEDTGFIWHGFEN